MGRLHSDHQLHGTCYVFDDWNLGVIALRNLDDPDKYRGTECVASLVDELTETPVEIGGVRTMDALLYPIRTTLPVPFLPFAAFSNPDGVGYSWVKQLFVDRDVESFGLTQEQVFFLQARITDNPKATPEMHARLQALTGNLYKSRFLGLWDSPEGARWPQLERAKHVFRMRDVFPQGLPHTSYQFMGVDWGKRAPYCALWIAAFDGDFYVYREDYMAGLDTSIQADRVANLTGLNEHIRIARFDPSMWAKSQSDGEFSGGPPKIEYFQKRLDERFEVLGKGFNKDRSRALETIDHLLSRDNGYPDLYIEESCVNLWRELSGAVWDTRGYLSGTREDLDPRCADHAITALYYATHAYLHPDDEPDEDDLSPDAVAEAYREQREARNEHSWKRFAGTNTLWGKRLTS